MKMTLFAMTAIITLLAGAAGCTVKAEEAQKTGGWEEAKDTAVTEEMKEMFDKASESLIGVDYTPTELIETQIVNGTNYKFLCEAQTVYPGAEKRTAVVTVYQDLEGNASILTIEAE